MKLRLAVAVAILGMFLVATPGWAERVQTSLNAGWRFHQGGERDTLDVTGWAPVTLPHSFNGGDGDRGSGYYRGAGWYRRTLLVPALPTRKRAYLEFDGAALVTDVFVNGRSVGHHEGGFARFRFDVTDALHVGSNVVAFKVDNARTPGMAPLGGDFTVFGGLYRPVSLIETGDVHIDDHVVATVPAVDHIACFKHVALPMGDIRITASGMFAGTRITDQIAWVWQAPSSFGVTALPAAERPAAAAATAKAPPGQ